MRLLSSPRFILRNLAAALALAVAACGGSSSSAATRPSSPGGSETAAAGDPACPVAVPGTSVTVEDTDTGAALVFVTTGDVPELRARAAAMARMHNELHGKMGPLPTGAESGGSDHGSHAGHGGGAAAGGDDHAAMGHGASASGQGGHAAHAGGMISVHSRADTAEVDGGARLVFIAGAAEVGKLQSELRMHAQHLASGSCAMGAR